MDWLPVCIADITATGCTVSCSVAGVCGCIAWAASVSRCCVAATAAAIGCCTSTVCTVSDAVAAVNG